MTSVLLKHRIAKQYFNDDDDNNEKTKKLKHGGGIFHVGISWVGIFRGGGISRGSLMGGNFAGGNFPGESFPDTLCHIWYFCRQDTTAWDRWALFCKKRVKNISFFLKICNKFIINKQRRYDRNLFTIVKSFQYRPIGFIT